MNILFYGTIAILRVIAYITGKTYEEVNIWGYCIIGPLLFYTLYMLLTILLTYKAFKVNTVIGKVLTLLSLLFGVYIIFKFPSVHYISTHIYPIYDNCVEYMYKIGGSHTLGAYVNANVWTLVIIGPLLFMLLTGTSTINVCTLTEKIKSWQLNTGIGILLISAIAMLYGISILKTLLY